MSQTVGTQLACYGKEMEESRPWFGVNWGDVQRHSYSQKFSVRAEADFAESTAGFPVQQRLHVTSEENKTLLPSILTHPSSYLPP